MGVFSKVKEIDWQKIKFGIHCVQAALIALAWILTIVVIAKPGGVGSPTWWYFVLTILSIPALLYQTVVPLWQRTRRLANPYVAAAVDLLFSLFWVAALAAVQVWTNSGITPGGTSYCDNFTFGDKDKCVISYGTVLLAVLIFLLWVLAAALAIYLVLFFRRNGYLPNSRPSISNPSVIEPKFSVSTGASSSAHPSRAGTKPGSLEVDLQQRDVEKGVPAGFTHTDTPLGTHPGRKLSYGNSPPQTAPSHTTVFNNKTRAGGRPQFRTPTYRPSGAGETTPLSPGMPAPQTAGGAPRLQVWAPGEGPALPRSPRAGYGTLAAGGAAAAAGGPVTADLRRVPPQYGAPSPVGTGAYAYAANRRPSLRNQASQHAAGYSTAHNSPLPTPVGRTEAPWGRKNE